MEEVVSMKGRWCLKYDVVYLRLVVWWCIRSFNCIYLCKGCGMLLSKAAGLIAVIYVKIVVC